MIINLLTTIALWCGQPGQMKTAQHVNDCREWLLVCVQTARSDKESQGCFAKEKI